MSQTMKYMRLSIGMAKFMVYPQLSLRKLAKLPKYSSLYLHMLNTN